MVGNPVLGQLANYADQQNDDFVLPQALMLMAVIQYRVCN